VIWGEWKQEYFFKRDSTQNCPTGKSSHGCESTFRSQRPLRCSAEPGPMSTLAVDPGSAAHRHSASKTRVNALMALRSIRGTTGASREVHQTYLTKECRKAVGWVEPAKPIISIKCN
jgi:hypothetical protein